MEAEISPSGDVSVEGHHVGQLDGFRFSADKSAEGEDAKAVKAAAAKALATEFEKRAERFAAAANGDFALGMDGVLRWLGQPVATLTASEEWLKPRVILLADEQLTGPARDKVAARAERFVGHHIETHLKPLVDLGRADELSGIARGIGFRLIENYGIVPRREIAEEIRSLDQDGRAALRRYGARFGFYHIFVPALIKPAPAGLLTLLWALQNDGKDKPGYGDVVQLLSTGRTSLVPDPQFDTAFYKLAGYRHLGSRAVRVDILERLADLIRPALQWREGSGPLPEGATGGGRFFVTPAMMSILGATAEDMEAVLGSLGYRHDKVEPAEFETKLAELKAANAPAEPEAPAAEVAPAAEEAPAPAEAAPANEASAPVEAAPAVAEEAAPEAAAETPAEEAVAETVEAPATEAAPEAAPVAETETAETTEPAEAEQAAAEPETEPTAEAEEAEEPKPVMVWYQVRGDRNRRGNRPQGKRQEGQRQGGQHHGGQRPDGEQQRNKGGKGKFRGKRDDRQRGKGEAFASAKPPRRDKPMDPDSPFAKLAALKDQMKK